MTYLHIDAELEGVDGYPEYEIGERFEEQDDVRVLSINNRRTVVAGEVEEEIANLTYLCRIDLKDDAYDVVKPFVEDNGALFVYDYGKEDYFLAEEL